MQLFACLSGGAGKKGKSVLGKKEKFKNAQKLFTAYFKKKKKLNIKDLFFWPDFQFLFLFPIHWGLILFSLFFFKLFFFLLDFDSELRKERVKGGK